jgi:hypothetical protein
MNKAVLAALAAVALLPLQSHAAATVESFNLRSAQDLVDLCAVSDDDPMVEAAHGFCYGFLSGVGGYHRAINAGANARPLFCLPAEKIPRVDAARMFVDWGRANPQYLAEAPVDALIRFAVATWPCAQAQR